MAATPAEFWRRWNRPASQFLHEYIFKPAGGIHHPVRAVMTAFVFNGLVHEYVFGIAAGRILGWQFIFFVIQGCATAATMRLRLTGFPRIVGILVTLIFNLATSSLFFWSLNATIPFYAAR